jgi:hypothetical protein
MSAESFSRGTRDNGLRCAGYQPVADLDPRIADAMLVTLRAAGIAAYASPTPAASGGYGELRLPSLPTDRLWADGEQIERARELLAGETAVDPAPDPGAAAAAPTAVDFDAAWQQVLTSLRSPSVREPDGRWPGAAEGPAPGAGDDTDLESLSGEFDELDEAAAVDPADHEHFVPPPAPPLPRLRSVTVGAITAIGLGLFALIFHIADDALRFVAYAAIVGGAISLIWNMRQGPPRDSGWDDGAVV